MRALVLAPQPFYSERGTPISEENLLRVMSSRGWQIDLLTYSEGRDIRLPGLTIHRIPAIPGVSQIPPGFSLRKVLSDAVMTVEAIRLARRGGYDLVHALEESVFIAAAIRKLFGIPYVYDMDSILSEQLVERYPRLAHVAGALRYCEEVAVSGSLGVLAVCESLTSFARRLAPEAFVARLEDRTQLGPPRPAVESLGDLVAPGSRILLYVGNLEPYQGIDLLLEGFAAAAPLVPDLSLVVIGGSERNVARYRARADELGLDGSVRLVGPRPVRDLRGYLEQADILVSPRIAGTNTPMKVYSFLDSGVPLLATRLSTHLQALDDDVARLFEPTPAGLAAALVELATDDGLRRRIAAAAGRRVARRYSVPAFEARAREFLREVERRVDAEGGRRHAGREAPGASELSRPADIRWPGTTHPSAAAPPRARCAARNPAPPLPA